MARKILVVYLVYTVIVFLVYTYIIKEEYINALLKSIISGVIFTAVYAFLAMRNEKRALEAENKKGDIKKTSPRKK
jgi:cobalamin biosynthesis protein CobD/CbiB